MSFDVASERICSGTTSKLDMIWWSHMEATDDCNLVELGGRLSVVEYRNRDKEINVWMLVDRGWRCVESMLWP